MKTQPGDVGHPRETVVVAVIIIICFDMIGAVRILTVVF